MRITEGIRHLKRLFIILIAALLGVAVAGCGSTSSESSPTSSEASPISSEASPVSSEASPVSSEASPVSSDSDSCAPSAG